MRANELASDIPARGRLLEMVQQGSSSPEHILGPQEHVLVTEDVDGNIPRCCYPVRGMTLPHRQVISQNLPFSSHIPEFPSHSFKNHLNWKKKQRQNIYFFKRQTRNVEARGSNHTHFCLHLRLYILLAASMNDSSAFSPIQLLEYEASNDGKASGMLTYMHRTTGEALRRKRELWTIIQVPTK